VVRARLALAAAGCCVTGAIVLLTAGAAGATFPGANGEIAFTREPGGMPASNVGIFTIGGDGQSLTQLTSGNGVRPSYSADGERIAFENSPPDGFIGIWVMNHDGSGQTQITPGSAAAEDFNPAFSPDRERIVFERNTLADTRIYTMNADGSGQIPLTNGDDSFSPSFSPDGQRIVFSREPPGSSEIWVMNADGSGQTRLTLGEDDHDPSFSPDGQQIAFQRFGGGVGQLYVMNADGSGPLRLTSGMEDSFNPVFSPDGTRIAFSRQDSALPGASLFLIDSNGQNITRLTADPGVVDFAPDWQPLNPPACELSGRSRSKSIKRVRVTVTCPDENATAVLEGSGKAPKAPTGAAVSKAKKFKLPAVTKQIPQATPTTVTLTVSKKGRKALKKAAKAGKKGKAAITATLTDDLGQSATDSFSVKFKPKKK
jgi:Tol biopolymer transport system component